MANKPVLGYWDIRGLGQPIRFLLAYLNVDYEEKRYSKKDDWFPIKHSLNLDFPNLPYWIEGDTRLTESRAIMKHICRVHNPELLGKTIEAQDKIEMVESWTYDFLDNGLVPVVYKYTEELHKQYKEVEPTKLGYLSNYMKDKQFVAGGNLSYIDFFLYDALLAVRGFDDKCLDAFPNLQEYIKRIESIPAVQKYMKDPTYIESPFFGREALYKL